MIESNWSLTGFMTILTERMALILNLGVNMDTLILYESNDRNIVCTYFLFWVGQFRLTNIAYSKIIFKDYMSITYF